MRDVTGIFRGIKLETGELIIAVEDGNTLVRSARVLPEDEGWVSESLKWVNVVSWVFGQGDERAGGHVPEVIACGPGKRLLDEGIDWVCTQSKREYAPLRIQKGWHKFGYTRGCPGVDRC